MNVATDGDGRADGRDVALFQQDFVHDFAQLLEGGRDTSLFCLTTPIKGE